MIRLLLRSSLIRIYTVCHSFYIFWRHYFNVKLNCFILRTTTVAGLGVPIFRVITVTTVAVSCKMCKKLWLEEKCPLLTETCPSPFCFKRFELPTVKNLNTETRVCYTARLYFIEPILIVIFSFYCHCQMTMIMK